MTQSLVFCAWLFKGYCRGSSTSRQTSEDHSFRIMFHCGVTVRICFFYCYEKHHDPNLGRKGSIWPGHSPPWMDLRTRSSRRTEAGMGEQGCLWLACFLILSNTCQRVAPLTAGWALPYQSLIKRMLPQMCSQTSLIEAISQLRFPLPKKLTLCQFGKTKQREDKLFSQSLCNRIPNMLADNQLNKKTKNPLRKPKTLV